MGEIILNALLRLIAIILYYIEVLLCKILDLVYSMFEVFSGITAIQYQGEQNFLINVFFDNPTIAVLFWGMACIGIVLTFVFAIWSVIKKTFDSNEKHKMSFGQILTNVFKSILIILLMSTIVTVSINAANVLMQQINYLFTNAESIRNPDSIVFEDEDYATMFRVLNTVANYSLNPSYDSTYNINACFNAIRGDLQILDRKSFFSFTYLPLVDGKEINEAYIKAHPDDEEALELLNSTSWQKAIRDIGVAADIKTDLFLDEYNGPVNKAIVKCVNAMKTDGSFKPVAKYERAKSGGAAGYGALLGRTIMVACTFEAANNNRYNTSPELTDEVRGPYYYGEKDIYSLGTVEDDFSIDFDKWNHIIAIAGTIWLIKNFLIIIMNCVARIFNILLLYIAAPPFIAMMPLDDGGKFKQWCTAFVIQLFGIFGTFVSVRLLIAFIPIILSPELILFDSSFTNIVAKLLIIIGVGFTATKASGIITGILADNAGMQSIMAGDVGAQAVGAMSAVGKKAVGLGLSVAATAGKGLANVTGLTGIANTIGDKFKNFNQSMKESKGGLIGAALGGFKTNEQRSNETKERREAKQEAANDKALGIGAFEAEGKARNQMDTRNLMANNKALGLDPTSGVSNFADATAKSQNFLNEKFPPKR